MCVSLYSGRRIRDEKQTWTQKPFETAWTQRGKMTDDLVTTLGHCPNCSGKTQGEASLFFSPEKRDDQNSDRHRKLSCVVSLLPCSEFDKSHTHKPLRDSASCRSLGLKFRYWLEISERGKDHKSSKSRKLSWQENSQGVRPDVLVMVVFKKITKVSKPSRLLMDVTCCCLE